jgi:hypothetical protein
MGGNETGTEDTAALGGQAASVRPAESGNGTSPVGTHTPGPWEYVPSDKHHGAYVVGPFGGDVCDCYTMSDPSSPSIRNGGTSRPIPFKGDEMDANARLIAAAPDLLAALNFILAFYEPGQRYLDTEAWKVAEASARHAVAKATGSQS